MRWKGKGEYFLFPFCAVPFPSTVFSRAYANGLSIQSQTCRNFFFFFFSGLSACPSSNVTNGRITQRSETFFFFFFPLSFGFFYRHTHTQIMYRIFFLNHSYFFFQWFLCPEYYCSRQVPLFKILSVTLWFIIIFFVISSCFFVVVMLSIS